jgi:hypothetical protein
MHGFPGRSRSSIEPERVRRSPIRFIVIPKRCEISRKENIEIQKGLSSGVKLSLADLQACERERRIMAVGTVVDVLRFIAEESENVSSMLKTFPNSCLS